MKNKNETEMFRVMNQFLSWHRQRGWQYKMAPYHIKSFDQFLQARGIDSFSQIDTVLLLEYQQLLRSSRSGSTTNGHFRTLRALWRFLLREERVDQDATHNVPHLPQDHFIPYLYSEDELQRIDQALKKAFGQATTFGPKSHRMMRRAVFRLLCDCGLRISEACKLDLDHYDARARTLKIERTKFFKTRIIPLPRSSCQVLNHYVALRPDTHVKQQNHERQALFLSMHGCRTCRNELGHAFRNLLVDIGLYRPRQRLGCTVLGSTNLHALRHRFAVSCLERWQRQRRDTEVLLPLLSGYMGHAHVSYTAVYLHLTPLLRQTASQNFQQMALEVLDKSGPSLLRPDDEDER